MCGRPNPFSRGQLMPDARTNTAAQRKLLFSSSARELTEIPKPHSIRHGLAFHWHQSWETRPLHACDTKDRVVRGHKPVRLWGSLAWEPADLFGSYYVRSHERRANKRHKARPKAINPTMIRREELRDLTLPTSLEMLKDHDFTH